MTYHGTKLKKQPLLTLSQNKPLIKYVLITVSEFMVQHDRADCILKGHGSVHSIFIFKTYK